MLQVLVGSLHLILTAPLPCASALHQEYIHLTLTAQKEQAEEQLRAECEELRLRSHRELQQLQEQLAKLQQHCTDSLLQAECHKQQVCVSLCVYLCICKQIFLIYLDIFRFELLIIAFIQIQDMLLFLYFLRCSLRKRQKKQL